MTNKRTTCSIVALVTSLFHVARLEINSHAGIREQEARPIDDATSSFPDIQQQQLAVSTVSIAEDYVPSPSNKHYCCCLRVLREHTNAYMDLVKLAVLTDTGTNRQKRSCPITILKKKSIIKKRAELTQRCLGV